MFKRTYSRYAETMVIDSEGTERNYLRTKPDTSPHPTDFYYTVKPHERIDQLAHKFYGQANLWWVIADFNDLLFPLVLEEGSTLRLPSYDRLITTILED